METVGVSLNEIPWFLAYFGTALILTLVYMVIYMWVTPHDEIKLIRENNMAMLIRRHSETAAAHRDYPRNP